jgi:hypothetical protein
MSDETTTTEVAAKEKRAKRKVILHANTHAVQIDNSPHLPLAELPLDQREYFERLGYSIHLLRSPRDPAVEHRGLVEGTLMAIKPDPEADWIRAAGHAHAAASLKSAGIRLAPKEDPTQHPTFVAALDKFNRVSPGFSSALKESFRTDPDVVHWYHKLTGAKKLDLAALVPADELAHAAE